MSDTHGARSENADIVSGPHLSGSSDRRTEPSDGTEGATQEREQEANVSPVPKDNPGSATVETLGRYQNSSRQTRALGALAILAAVAFSATYWMIPVWFRYRESGSTLQSFVLSAAAIFFGTLASAYYLRTGRIPFLQFLSRELEGTSTRNELGSNASQSNVSIRDSEVTARLVARFLESRQSISKKSPVPGVDSSATQPLTLESVLDAAIAGISTRLQKEIPELTKRANLNLTFGIFFALGGMLALWWAAAHVASSFDPAKDWKPVLLAAVPRVSLALVVELFSYFFLGLYRTSLTEIKYFENEITTAEMRLLALRVAAQKSDTEGIKAVLLECARTERNFRLSKDESTVELEREKLNNSFADKVLDRIGDILRK